MWPCSANVAIMLPEIRKSEQTKTLLFFSCEPGGAEVLIPVIDLVSREAIYRVVVLAYGLGAERLACRGGEYTEVEKITQGDPAILQAYRPNLLITSATSLPERDMSEKYLWQTARQLGVPSLAFLDQWQNYAIRFSGVGEGERLAYLPDYINCIDEIGEVEMLREGFPAERLVKLGHPHLSSVRDQASKVDVAAIKSRLSIPDMAEVFLFVSEAILEHYGRTRGYDQYQALELFLNTISKLPGPVVPIIKLHPKDRRDRFEDILKSFNGPRPILLGGEYSPEECLVIADRVFGMTSIMLVEAYVLGKQVISLQPGLKIEDPLVLTRHHLIPVILSQNENIMELNDAFKCHENSNLNYDFVPAEFRKLLNAF